MEIGKHIKYYREQMGYSQKDLADIIHMSERAVGHYETGKRSPSLETVGLLAKALHKQIADFFQPLSLQKREGKGMNVERFQRKMMKRYLNSKEVICFEEDENFVKVHNISEDKYEEIYDKKLANHMLSLADKQTIIQSMYYKENSFLTVTGISKGVHFSIHCATNCIKHEAHFCLQADPTHIQNISPIIESVRKTCVDLFQIHTVRYDFFAYAYFCNFNKEQILSYEMDNCTIFFTSHTFEILKENGMLQIHRFIHLKKEELVCIPSIENHHLREILQFQELLKEWVERVLK